MRKDANRKEILPKFFQFVEKQNKKKKKNHVLRLKRRINKTTWHVFLRRYVLTFVSTRGAKIKLPMSRPIIQKWRGHALQQISLALPIRKVYPSPPHSCIDESFIDAQIVIVPVALKHLKFRRKISFRKGGKRD